MKRLLTGNEMVRPLTTAELPRLTELFSYHNVDEMIEENTVQIESGSREIFVLLQKERLIGELHVTYDCEDKRFAEKGRRAYLFAFRVHRDFQNQGLGTYLLEEVLRLLIEKGYREFTVGVEDDNARARYIYEKYGFTLLVARQKENYQGDSYEYDLLMRQVFS